jgi:hypothetical protein
VNHTTTIGIAAIIALAAITPGILAIGTAYAGGHSRGHGHNDDGDAFIAKTLAKQKNTCWSVDNSTTHCENNASVFGSNVHDERGTSTTKTTPTLALAFP